MSQKYYLPCPACGTKHVVDVTRLGVPFACSCGKPDLEVASLRELRGLEPVDDPTVKTETPWGPRQGLMLLGGVICIAAALASLGVYRGMSQLKMPLAAADDLAKYVDKATLNETFEMWRMLRTTPIDSYAYGVEASQEEAAIRYQMELANRRIWCGVFAGVSVLGLVLHGIGWSIPPSGTPPAAPRRKRPPAFST